VKIRLLGHYFLSAASLVDSYVYDFVRFCRHSQMVGKTRSKIRARANLMLAAHALEKGLALPEPRPGFGVTKCFELLDESVRFHQRYGPDSILGYVEDVFASMIAFHREDEKPYQRLTAKLASCSSIFTGAERSWTRRGGLIKTTREQIVAAAPPDPFEFFNQRHSVREFSREPVALEHLKRAAQIAQLAPSVCNRQAGRIHYSMDPRKIERILACQRGNLGFGDRAPVACIITAEIGVFNKPGERNQQFIDGGLFAMTFALGLHSLGLGACFLNWSVTAQEDRKLRASIDLPTSETVVVVMVIGNLKPEFVVAASPRQPLADVLSAI
jgi:nitroreductase